MKNKFESPSESLEQKMSLALDSAYKAEIAKREAELKPDEGLEVSGLGCLDSSEKIISILKEIGIDTSSLKIEVNNADLPLENQDKNGGTNYANCEIKIFKDDKIVLNRNFMGPEMGGWQIL